MRLQDLRQFDTAVESLTACGDVDMLLGTLLDRIRALFRTEGGFIWLTTEGEKSYLHLAEGAPASVVARLQRLKISPNGERAITRRLHKLGYRAVLAAPMRLHGKAMALVAVGSERVRPSWRTGAAMFHL